jgi:hypothetical protein
MKRIILISCVKKKLPFKAKAEDLYISTLFRFNLEYARSFHPDEIYILSAEHELLDLNQEIEPYEKTLNKMLVKEIKEWAARVIEQLKKKVDLQEDEFIFLAGEKYRKYLLPYISKNAYALSSGCFPIYKLLVSNGFRCNTSMDKTIKKFFFPETPIKTIRNFR